MRHGPNHHFDAIDKCVNCGWHKRSREAQRPCAFEYLRRHHSRDCACADCTAVRAETAEYTRYKSDVIDPRD